MPPFHWAARWAEGFEQVGARLWPQFSGLIPIEAIKQTFAVKPKGARSRVRVFAPGVLPAPTGPAPARSRRLLEKRPDSP